MRCKYYGNLRHGVEGVETLQPASKSVYNPHKYGLPELKKFPMPDAAHVKSAIKFFNYVSPKDEKQLAQAILNRMKEFGVTDVNVGPDNRFSKYYTPDDVLQHSSGEWINKKYKDKIQLADGTWRYVYDNTDLSAIGSRLNGGQMTGNNENIHSNNQGVNGSPSHQSAVRTQNSLRNYMERSVKDVTGMNNAPKNNQGVVGKKDEKDVTGKNNAPKNNQGVVGNKDEKPASADDKDKDTKTATTNDSKSGKKGGGSGKKGSGKKGSSGSDKSDKAKASNDKALKKQKDQLAKKQKEIEEERKREREENKRKEDERFEQRRRENEKRWKAEEERMEKMRDTSRESVSKETLSEIVDMLKDSDKEYAKKLLEGGRSKIDDYLDWLKESRKNNQKK